MILNSFGITIKWQFAPTVYFRTSSSNYPVFAKVRSLELASLCPLIFNLINPAVNR